MTDIRPSTISRLDRYFSAQRRETHDGDTEIRREEPEEDEVFDPEWHEIGEAGA